MTANLRGASVLYLAYAPGCDNNLPRGAKGFYLTVNVRDAYGKTAERPAAGPFRTERLAYAALTRAGGRP